jgi:hypothetical protein
MRTVLRSIRHRNRARHDDRRRVFLAANRSGGAAAGFAQLAEELTKARSSTLNVPLRISLTRPLVLFGPSGQSGFFRARGPLFGRKCFQVCLSSLACARLPLLGRCAMHVQPACPVLMLPQRTLLRSAPTLFSRLAANVAVMVPTHRTHLLVRFLCVQRSRLFLRALFAATRSRPRCAHGPSHGLLNSRAGLFARS